MINFSIGLSIGLNERLIRYYAQKFSSSAQKTSNKKSIKPRKFDFKSGEKLLNFLQYESQSTRGDMQIFLNKIEVNVSKTTIHRFLQNKLITIKLTRMIQTEKNSLRARLMRKDYVNWLQSDGINQKV